MKKKIPILFYTFSTINIISILVFSIIVIYLNIHYEPGENYKSGLIVLFLLVVVYGINYRISLNMVRQYRRKTGRSTKTNITRRVFYILEGIVFPFYGYAVYSSTHSILPAGFPPKDFIEAILFVAFSFFALGFLSSMIRIILMWPFYKILKDRNIETKDDIGEIDPDFLKNISAK